MSKRNAKTIFKKPDFSALDSASPTFQRDWWKAESYLRTEIKTSSFKKEALKWLKKRGYKLDPFKEVSDWEYSTVGKLCYVLNRDGDIPESGDKWLKEKVLKIKEKGMAILKEKKAIADKKKKVPKRTIQDFLQEKAAAVCGEEFEGIVDQFISDPKKFKAKNYEPLRIMRANEFSQGHARHVIKFYEKELEDVVYAINNFKTKEVKEYYGGYTLAQVKELRRFYEKIIDSANIIINQSIAKRKPRKKKAVDPSKRVENLNYCKEESRVGLSSVNPVDILGAKEVWYYNVKTRKLGRFIAQDPQIGLDVKGASIINFSTEKSIQKNLRKPVEQLRSFKDGGIRKFNKHYKEISSMELKIKSGRVNNNMILFKVFK